MEVNQVSPRRHHRSRKKSKQDNSEGNSSKHNTRLSRTSRSKRNPASQQTKSLDELEYVHSGPPIGQTSSRRRNALSKSHDYEKNYLYFQSQPKTSSIDSGFNLNGLGINDFGREKVVGSLESEDVFNAKREFEEYEKKQKKKKENLLSEIEELQKKRENTKSSIKLDHIQKEAELLKKQKELNEFEKKLINRQAELHDKEKSVERSLKQLNESEAAIQKRRKILQRTQNNLSNIAKIQDMGILHQQLGERKQEIRRKGEAKDADSESILKERAKLNWDFLKSVFHDRSAMLNSSLKQYQTESARCKQLLHDKTTECDNYKKLSEHLEKQIKLRDSKIKELESHLTVLVQQQAKMVHFNEEDEDNPDEEEDSKNDNRGFFSRRKSARKSINGDTMKMNYDFGEDKYVSQTCNVM